MITFAKPTMLTITPATTRTLEVPAVTFSTSAIDWTQVEEWSDNPNAQTLHARLQGWPKFQIMGAGTRTPYNPTWMEADAQAAFLAQLGVTVTNGVGSV